MNAITNIMELVPPECQHHISKVTYSLRENPLFKIYIQYVPPNEILRNPVF